MTLFVVGNVTEDLVFGLPRLPGPGETLIADSRISDIGGKGFNQALIAARAGMPVRLIAPIGRDEAGRRAWATARGERLQAVLIETDGPTDQSIIAVAEGGENHIVSTAFAAIALTGADVAAAAADAGVGDQLLMQGNLSLETTLAVLRWARDRNVKTTVNPSPIRWDYSGLWPLIDRLILNRPELAALSGVSDLSQGIATLAAHGIAEIIVTCGADGAILATGAQRQVAAAVPVGVVDTAGAGDTFCGVLIAARDRGVAPAAAMRLAAQAASITIGRKGTFSAFPTATELADLFAAQERT